MLNNREMFGAAKAQCTVQKNLQGRF